MFLGFGNKEKHKLDVEEAYILWRLLSNRYLFISHIQHLKNFTHDKDFNVVLGKLLNDWRKEAGTLEAQLEKFSLKGAQPPAAGQGAPGNSAIVIDRVTAEVAFAFMRLDLHRMLSAMKDTLVNDSVRDLLFTLLKSALDRVDKFIGYIKVKNWVFYPPLFPHVKPGLQIAINEVFLLWDHLVFRYNNIRKTQFYAEMTAEPDFKPS